jgi:hypothetical protein
MNVRSPFSTRVALSALTALGIALVAACSSSSEGSDGTDCHDGDYAQCACDDGSTGKKACGSTVCECAVKSTSDASTPADSGADPVTTGDGGHNHDGATTESDAAPGTYGASCKVDGDCTDPVYNKCFTGGNRAFCTKACTTSAECPTPLTAGVCNKQSRCK